LISLGTQVEELFILLKIQEIYRIIENFEMINVEDLEEIVMRLSKKKGTEEGITSDILK